jgi:hypothetical protein
MVQQDIDHAVALWEEYKRTSAARRQHRKESKHGTDP